MAWPREHRLTGKSPAPCFISEKTASVHVSNIMGSLVRLTDQRQQRSLTASTCWSRRLDANNPPEKRARLSVKESA
jgi:hypothetical protein